jgi:Domain of unknown function (DUF4386)
MSNDEQLAWEARAGRLAGAAAFAAAAMAIVSGLYLNVALSDRESGADGALRSADQEPGDFITQGVLQAIGLLLLIPVLLYLFRATRHRREVPPAAAVLVVLGAVTLAVGTILRQLEIIDIAHDFFPEKASKAKDVEDAAEDFIRDSLSPALQGVALGGALALAISMVMISLNAMRAGLLSRFMGILGIFVGVFLVIPLGLPIVQLFWFGALGMLFLSRWPGGRGPAWETGEDTPWPSAADARAERMEASAADLDPAPEPEPGSPRPASRKRKKRR